MMKKLAVLTLAFGLTAFTGCKSIEGTHWEDRINDTLDIIPVSFATGEGFYLGARVSQYAGTGLGWARTERMGWARRKQTRNEELAESLEGYVSWPEEQWGAVLTWQRNDDPSPGAGNVGFVVPMMNTPAPRRTWDMGSSLDVEVEAHLWLVGFRIAASPVQFADWLAGWARIDFLEDDRNMIEGKYKPYW